MTKVIQCPCGYVIRAGDDDSLVRLAQDHALATHALELTREQALAMAKPEPTGRKELHVEGTEV